MVTVSSCCRLRAKREIWIKAPDEVCWETRSMRRQKKERANGSKCLSFHCWIIEELLTDSALWRRATSEIPGSTQNPKPSSGEPPGLSDSTNTYNFNEPWLQRNGISPLSVCDWTSESNQLLLFCSGGEPSVLCVSFYCCWIRAIFYSDASKKKPYSPVWEDNHRFPDATEEISNRSKRRPATHTSTDGKHSVAYEHVLETKRWGDRYAEGGDSVRVRIRLIMPRESTGSKSRQAFMCFVGEFPSQVSTMAQGIISLSREHWPGVNLQPSTPHRFPSCLFLFYLSAPT